MTYIIIEDEKLSAERLKAMICRLMPGAECEIILDSVRSAVKWLSGRPSPDLAFFDIQLADGLSFEIFEQVRVEFPVIFTTAFNEYALKAFKVNSIDYLLKPIDEDELANAMDRFEKGYYQKSATLERDDFARVLNMLGNSYKRRFLVKAGEHIRMIPVEEVPFFFSSGKATFIRTFKGRDYGIDFSLDQLATLLNPADFCRVNRKYIIALTAINDIITYSGSRLKLKLSVPADEDILVSRERVQGFKSWLDR